MSIFSTISAQALAEGIPSLYSARQAEENQRRDISSKERFAKNKYQWQMKDMRKAGLNPILAAGASPGSAGAGGTASGGQLGSSQVGTAAAANRVAKQLENKNQAEIDELVARKAAANAAEQEAKSRTTAQDIQNNRQKRLDNLLYTDDLVGNTAIILDHSPTPAAAASGTAKMVNQAAKARQASKAVKSTDKSATQIRREKRKGNRMTSKFKRSQTSTNSRKGSKK